MLAVDGLIHGPHIVRGDFSCKGVESVRDLRPALQRLIAHQRDCLVGREVVLDRPEAP